MEDLDLGRELGNIVFDEISEDSFIEPKAKTYWEKKSLIQEAFISDMFSLIVGTLPELHKEVADGYLQNYYASVEELASE